MGKFKVEFEKVEFIFKYEFLVSSVLLKQTYDIE